MTTGQPKSKTELRRAIKKVIAKQDIVEKLFLTQYAALRALPKERHHNLEELDIFFSTLGRILIGLQDNDLGDDEIKSQHFCLMVKEKHVREYSKYYWLRWLAKKETLCSKTESTNCKNWIVLPLFSSGSSR